MQIDFDDRLHRLQVLVPISNARGDKLGEKWEWLTEGMFTEREAIAKADSKEYSNDYLWPPYKWLKVRVVRVTREKHEVIFAIKHVV